MATQPPASGPHTRRSYAALLSGLHQAARTGILEIRSGRHWRRLYVVAGTPAWSSSDTVEDELATSLVQAGLVDGPVISKLRKGLAPYDNLGSTLVKEGLIEAFALQEHRTDRLESAVAAPLAWGRGEWTFQAQDDLPEDRLDPALLPNVFPLRALWVGAQTHVTMDEALQVVASDAAGEIRPAAGLPTAFELLAPESPLDRLPTALGSGLSIEDLVRQIPDRSGHLMRLVWLLQTAGLLRRDPAGENKLLLQLAQGKKLVSASPAKKKTDKSSRTRPAASRQGPSTKGTAAAGSAPAAQDRGRPEPGELTEEQKKAAENLSGLIRTAYRHRMGKDFYSFLDLPHVADSARIRSSYERLSRGWRAAADAPGVSDNDRRLVKELAAAALLAYQTLSDSSQRQEYDDRLARGVAPTLQGPTDIEGNPVAELGEPQSVGISDQHARARSMIDKGNYREATSLLHALREDEPSSAEVLADLGWCLWLAGKSGRSSDEAPEDFLLLAQTFDPSCARALEFLARIAEDTGKDEDVQKWASKLLAVVPDHGWARSIVAGSGGHASARSRSPRGGEG